MRRLTKEDLACIAGGEGTGWSSVDRLDSDPGGGSGGGWGASGPTSSAPPPEPSDPPETVIVGPPDPSPGPPVQIDPDPAPPPPFFSTPPLASPPPPPPSSWWNPPEPSPIPSGGGGGAPPTVSPPPPPPTPSVSPVVVTPPPPTPSEPPPLPPPVPPPPGTGLPDPSTFTVPEITVTGSTQSLAARTAKDLEAGAAELKNIIQNFPLPEGFKAKLEVLDTGLESVAGALEIMDAGKELLDKETLKGKLEPVIETFLSLLNQAPADAAVGLGEISGAVGEFAGPEAAALGALFGGLVGFFVVGGLSDAAIKVVANDLAGLIADRLIP